MAILLNLVKLKLTMKEHVHKQALNDDDVIASLASKIAALVANKIGDRLDLLEKTLIEKDKRFDLLGQALDDLEQYSRRSPVSVSGIQENGSGEQLDTVVTALFNDMDMPLTLNNVNRTHRIGPTISITNISRKVIIQFKDYDSKTKSMKARKQPRGK